MHFNIDNQNCAKMIQTAVTQNYTNPSLVRIIALLHPDICLKRLNLTIISSSRYTNYSEYGKYL